MTGDIAATTEAMPHIGVCGAGIAGLTLAGILSRRLTGRVRVSVFERAAADRDQGYGLDLDEHGQEALARAGVYHRYWDISRPFSDCMAWLPMQGDEPLGVYFRPASLRRLFPAAFAARPETNRGALRDVLLEAIAERKDTHVYFETPVADLRAEADGRVALLDASGAALGAFDLVIDAMGLHSTLRLHRVTDAEGSRAGTGNILIHGVIEDPDHTCGPELVGVLERFGTAATFGRGQGVFVQRFGAGPDDNRISVFYLASHLDDEAQAFREIGIEPPDSRASGIMRDDRLDRVKAWVLDDMGDAFDPLWRNAISCLERVTVREEMTHGDSTLRDDCQLPLVCIGDSLRNCGLGGGGILAMQDAIELSKLLEAHDAFDTEGRVNLVPLRPAEAVMMKRKQSFAREKAARFNFQRGRARELGRGPGSLADWFPAGLPLFLARLLLPAFGRLTRAWYRRERRRLGRVGSDASAPIYPNVRRLLRSGDGA